MHVPAAPPSSSAQKKTSTLPHDSARSHIAAAVTDLFRLWQRNILEHPPYLLDTSPRDYDLFLKVKELLRGTRYNTRDEPIRGRPIWLSIRNINKDERTDSVRRLPNILQRVINKGCDYIDNRTHYTIIQSTVCYDTQLTNDSLTTLIVFRSQNYPDSFF